MIPTMKFAEAMVQAPAPGDLARLTDLSFVNGEPVMLVHVGSEWRVIPPADAATVLRFHSDCGTVSDVRIAS